MLEKLQEIFGKKGVWIVAAVAGGAFLLSLLTSKKEEGTTLVEATAYSSYPDAVTNANVIIDSVNEYTDFSTGQILDKIESTNGYIENGLANLNTSINNGFASMGDAFDDLDADMESIKSDLSGIKNNTNTLLTRPSGSTVIYAEPLQDHDDSYLEKEVEPLQGGNAQYKDPDPDPVTNLGHADGSIVILNGKPVTATATLKKAGS